MKQPQNIPQCFQDKMLLDNRIEHLRKLPIINFIQYRRIKNFQDTARFRCMAVIKHNRDPRGGAAA